MQDADLILMLYEYGKQLTCRSAWYKLTYSLSDGISICFYFKDAIDMNKMVQAFRVFEIEYHKYKYNDYGQKWDSY